MQNSGPKLVSLLQHENTFTSNKTCTYSVRKEKRNHTEPFKNKNQKPDLLSLACIGKRAKVNAWRERKIFGKSKS